MFKLNLTSKEVSYDEPNFKESIYDKPNLKKTLIFILHKFITLYKKYAFRSVYLPNITPHGQQVFACFCWWCQYR